MSRQLMGPAFMEVTRKLNAINGFSEDIHITLGRDTFELLRREVVEQAAVSLGIGADDKFDMIKLNTPECSIFFTKADA